MKILGLLLVITVSACTRTEYGPRLSESVTVEDVVYTPDTHGSGIAPGFTSDGKMSVSFVSIDTDPIYAVVFQCQHGKFIIKDKATWEKATKGATGNVTYREVIAIKKDGRHLVGYDFLTYTPKDAQ